MHQASRPQGIVYKILIFSQHAQTSPFLCVVPSHSWFGLFNSKSDRCRLPLVPRRWGCSWPGRRACVMLVVRRPHCPAALLVSSLPPSLPLSEPSSDGTSQRRRWHKGTRGPGRRGLKASAKKRLFPILFSSSVSPLSWLSIRPRAVSGCSVRFQ